MLCLRARYHLSARPSVGNVSDKYDKQESFTGQTCQSYNCGCAEGERDKAECFQKKVTIRCVIVLQIHTTP